MTTATPAIDREMLQDVLREWNEREETLDDQLAESLAALDAYQSHLDAWQRDLAEERRALAHDRENLEANQGGSKDAAARLDKLTAELNDARQQVATLSKSLLDRTEELRQLDIQRAELATQLELARARERELLAKVDTQGGDGQPPQWAEELKQLRELLERRADHVDADEAIRDIQQVATSVNHCRSDDHSASENQCASESPVLGSLMQQFGKLRQQRSQDQRSRKKMG